MSSKPLHIVSLDGLRAVAVMVVFVAHSGLGGIIPGGFGVTIFFFLSGYLITTLLRVEFEKSGTVSIKDFYLRRVFRIFPPLYIVLAVILSLTTTGVFQHSMSFSLVLGQFFHLTNYLLIYQGEEHLIPGTGVLWSLCVEEHFYLLFPALFIVLRKRMNCTQLGLVFASLCAVVLAWRCYLVMVLGVNHGIADGDMQPTYLATDTRIDSILYGCIMGVWANPVLDNDVLKGELKKGLVLAGCIAVLLITFLYRDSDFRETFRYSLQGLALFPIFYLAVRRSGWRLFSWLDWTPVRWLGMVSYTMYLFHPTASALTGFIPSNNPWLKVSVSLALVSLFSLLMYFVVERHMAGLRRKIAHA